MNKPENHHALLKQIVDESLQFTEDRRRALNNLVSIHLKERNRKEGYDKNYLDTLKTAISAIPLTTTKWSNTLHTLITGFTEQLPLSTQEQTDEVFFRQKTDDFPTSFAKTITRIGWGHATFGTRIGNTYRGIRKQPKKHLPRFKHTVNHSALSLYWYNWLLRRALYEWHLERVQEEVTFLHNMVKEGAALEASLPLPCSEAATQNIQQLTQDAYQGYVEESRIFGTWQLPKRRRSLESTARKSIQLEEAFIRTQEGWNNNMVVLLEKLHLFHEIQISSKDIDQSQGHFSYQYLQQKKVLENEVNTLVNLSRKIRSNVSEVGVDAKAKNFTKIQYLYKKDQDKANALETIEKEANKQTLSDLNHFESLVRSSIQVIKPHQIYTRENYSPDKAIPARHIDTIDFAKLITLKQADAMLKALDDEKRKIIYMGEELTEAVTSFDQSIEYGLDTAKDAIEDTETGTEEALSTLQSSLERSEKLIQEAVQEWQAERDKIQENLNKAADKLEEDLKSLSKADFTELRMELIKSKAIRESENLIGKGTEFVKIYTDKVKRFSIKSLRQSRAILKSAYKQLGLSTLQEDRQKEVSNFLLDYTTQINQLPLAYRRLFKIEPIKDERLFVGRSVSLDRIQKAYSDWQNGKQSHVILYDEQFSGLTTLLNFTIKRIKFNYPVIRIEIKEHYKSFVDIINLLSETEGMKDFTANRENPPKRIIFLENIHYLYRRTFDGTHVIRDLIQLIHRTNNHLFWITTCSRDAYKYLEKSINLNDFFAYPIEPVHFTAEDIREMILSRVRMTGFKLHFQRGHQGQSRKYKKLTEKEKQDYLEQQFFKNLSSFAKGNVSLALVFWLLHTTKAEDNQGVLHIKTFQAPDFTFIKDYRLDKIFLLLTLILHGACTLENFRYIQFGVNGELEWTLLALQEDGVILKEEDRYIINPIVYRTVRNVLLTKNMLL